MTSPEPRSESLIPQVSRVVGGHLREDSSYATWRSSGTNDWLLLYTVSGSGRIGGSGGEIVTVPGDAVLLRPHVRHDYGTATSSPGWDLRFAHFHPRAEWPALLEWPQAVEGVGRIHTTGEVSRRVVAALQRVASMSGGALARAELFAVNALEEALLWFDTQNPLTTRMDERLLTLIDHVDSHLGEPLDVTHLAAVVNLSASRLSHLFSMHFGTSPQRYVERQRMMRAQQLLDLTTRPIAEIARETGWDDPLYFSQRFRRFTGISPSAYRKASTTATSSPVEHR